VHHGAAVLVSVSKLDWGIIAEGSFEDQGPERLGDVEVNPFTILCEDDETTVVTAGPDRKEGTADDIRVPGPMQARM